MVTSCPLADLSKSDMNLKVDEVPSSGCSTGKEQIIAPPGDL